jgi:hypothetical protein
MGCGLSILETEDLNEMVAWVWKDAKLFQAVVEVRESFLPPLAEG